MSHTGDLDAPLPDLPAACVEQSTLNVDQGRHDGHVVAQPTPQGRVCDEGGWPDRLQQREESIATLAFERFASGTNQGAGRQAGGLGSPWLTTELDVGDRYPRRIG